MAFALLVSPPLTALAAGAPAKLLSRTCRTRGGQTQVAFTFNRPSKYHYFALKHPVRLVLDVSHARAEHAAHGTAAGCGRVSRVRWAERKGGVLRYVMTLPAGTPARVIASRTNGKGRFLLSVRIGKPEKAGSAASAPTPAGRKAVRSVMHLQSGKGPILVAIDPGHGGSDPGTHGPHGLDEKTVTLAVAKYLKRRIDGTPGLKAFLTRRRDRYVGLRRRVLKAQDRHANLFVSIHANSFPRVPAVDGGAVYALSEHGASSAEAKLLARTENAADPTIGNIKFASHDKLVNSALTHLAQRASIAAGTQLGASVLHHLAHVEPLYEHHVQFANFEVLRDPVIPSILVETAFLSNPKQARDLHHARFRHQLADAIYAGIREFLHDHDLSPARVVRAAGHGARQAGSRSGHRAPHQGERTYTVGHGDTLSGIAVKLGVSQWRLKAYNHLDNPHLQAGRTLRVPPPSFRYHVRPGDSLSVIAAKADVSVSRLKAANGLDGSRLRAGEVLTVPPAGGR